jgi:hypothetical protein
MPSERPDGGPAFPAEGGHDSGLHPAPGMSLRDYFAAAALVPVMRWRDGDPLPRIAAMAYEFADAMLKAREQS